MYERKFKTMKKPKSAIPDPFPKMLTACTPEEVEPALELFRTPTAITRMRDRVENETAHELYLAAVRAEAAAHLGKLLVVLGTTARNVAPAHQKVIDEHLPGLAAFRWVVEYLGRWPVPLEMFRRPPPDIPFPHGELYRLIGAIRGLIGQAAIALEDAGATPRLRDTDDLPFWGHINFEWEPEPGTFGSAPCPPVRPTHFSVGSYFRAPVGLVRIVHPFDEDFDNWLARVMEFRQRLSDYPAVTVRALMAASTRDARGLLPNDSLVMAELLRDPNLTSPEISRITGVPDWAVRRTPAWEQIHIKGAARKGGFERAMDDVAMRNHQEDKREV